MGSMDKRSRHVEDESDVNAFEASIGHNSGNTSARKSYSGLSDARSKLLHLQTKNNFLSARLNEVTQELFTVRPAFAGSGRLMSPLEISQQYLPAATIDVVGFSDLRSDAAVATVQLLMSSVSAVCGRYNVLHSTVRGDRVAFVFDRADTTVSGVKSLTNILAANGVRVKAAAAYGPLNFFEDHDGRLAVQGDPLTMAARLEALARPDELLVTEHFRFSDEVVEDEFKFARTTRTMKKGFGALKSGEKIQCYSVIRRVPKEAL